MELRDSQYKRLFYSHKQERDVSYQICVSTWTEQCAKLRLSMGISCTYSIASMPAVWRRYNFLVYSNDTHTYGPMD
jgi:hypothetical protein